MILEETYRYLLTNQKDRLENLTLTRVQIGMFLTAVGLSDGGLGMAGTLPDAEPHCTGTTRDFGDFTPGHIVGKRVTELFETQKQSGLISSLRIAVLNAISSRELAGNRYHILEDTDPVDLIDPDFDGTITIVGAFQSYIRKLSGKRSRLNVLELNENALSAEHRKHYIPAAGFREVLPGSGVVIITGLTLVNNTIDGLLSAITPGTRLIVTGPSSSVIPDVLFRHHVTHVGATRITRPDLLFDLVGQGGAGYHLFRYCARKICLARDPV
ncbi:MAG TPA: DUF364 domain-containing protein [Bacteroidales bacterium]|nr:DUF364 domain-containing protein [Bacteroidales bacterium]HPS61443.1 DUF364 domain-containing protein [Bacteroidales bacterium]